MHVSKATPHWNADFHCLQPTSRTTWRDPPLRDKFFRHFTHLHGHNSWYMEGQCTHGLGIALRAAQPYPSRCCGGLRHCHAVSVVDYGSSTHQEPQMLRHDQTPFLCKESHPFNWLIKIKRNLSDFHGHYNGRHRKMSGGIPDEPSV
jgi:hypothetical protein